MRKALEVIQKVHSLCRMGWGWGWVLKKWTKTNRRTGGQAYLYVRSVKKNCLIFEQQAEFFLISCSLVDHIKCVFLLKRRRHFFSFNAFLWTCKYLCYHCTYNCVKNIDLLCWVYKKINYFLSLIPPPFPPIFYSK